MLEFFRANFLDACYQYQKGPVKGTSYLKGIMTLKARPTSTYVAFKLFDDEFHNIEGLTLSPIVDIYKNTPLVMKSKGRILGPYFANPYGSAAIFHKILRFHKKPRKPSNDGNFFYFADISIVKAKNTSF